MTRYWVHSAPEGLEVEAEQRPCARGERCKSPTVWYDDDGSMHREPALGPRAFCDKDRAEIAQALDRLPDRYLELAVRLGEKQSIDGPKVTGGGASAPAPIRLDIDALMVRIVHIAASWDVRVAAVANLTDNSSARPERRGSQSARVALTQICRRLGAHLDALIALPAESMVRYVSEREAAEHVTALAADTYEYAWLAANCRIEVNSPGGLVEMIKDLDGADAGMELLALDSRARHLIGWTPQHQALSVPCWKCGLKTIRRLDGGAGLEDRAECSNPGCREAYEDDRFTLLMGEVEKAARARQAKAAS
jgi:hypothetical protein